MTKQSAGILLYRIRNKTPEVFLIHMGGPFWAKKDEGAWSIPKGEFTSEEEPLNAAVREFTEETGFAIDGDFIPLQSLKQSGGKIIYAWAVQGDCDASQIKSNLFEMEWPPRSGHKKSFPEADRADWFVPSVAKTKIIKSQQALISELELLLKNAVP